MCWTPSSTADHCRWSVLFLLTHSIVCMLFFLSKHYSSSLQNGCHIEWNLNRIQSNHQTMRESLLFPFPSFFCLALLIWSIAVGNECRSDCNDKRFFKVSVSLKWMLWLQSVRFWQIMENDLYAIFGDGTNYGSRWGGRSIALCNDMNVIGTNWDGTYINTYNNINNTNIHMYIIRYSIVHSRVALVWNDLNLKQNVLGVRTPRLKGWPNGSGGGVNSVGGGGGSVQSSSINE